ncbi:MAG TPA: endonuclease III [Phycisphaerales bacterium]|nr:endonuclease III [Phycisphaerales bacterium]HCD33834.1 endonuclease III [Phycisphaerales bacterium]|tara:strand:+ start:216 stop:887 length:672 start_codon:yes stop_codon:yes gene_type:complete
MADRKPTKATKDRAARLYAQLEQLYPEAHCALDHRNAFELLVATILSAQCTDERVNMVTPALFKKYPTPQKMAKATQQKLEELVRTTGFYRNKAKNILGAATRIVEVFDGKVPNTMDDLLSLPGVARKTANVVLGNAFGINVGIVVDTHVGRLAWRMGLLRNARDTKDAVKIEKDLIPLFEQDNWTMLSHLLISHGRSLCKARKPDCENCSLISDCKQKDVSK